MSYAELHARTAFSFLDGASSPDELLERALELGLDALAITDRDGMYGVVEAREALVRLVGLERGEEGRARLRLLYGSELSYRVGAGASAVEDRAVALVHDLPGYHNLCATLSVGRLAAPKGEFRLTQAELLARPGGLWLLAGGPRSAAMRALCAGEAAAAERNLGELREAFGDRLVVELVRHRAPGDLERSRAMAALADRLGLPTVASNDVHFHVRARKELHDVLRCIGAGVTIAEAGRRLLPNGEAHLKPAGEMVALFADRPQAIERGRAIARAIDFRLCDVRYRYPPAGLAPGETADGKLARLCRAGLTHRLGEVAAAPWRAQLERELALVAELDYAGYFLSMWEIVETCKARGILCQGRGSAANSLVCFSLGVTSVRPHQINMMFERFLSRERAEPPDIDLDIEHERREEILQHVYRTFGRDHAGMVAETIRYQRRSAMRDVGRALGLPEAELARLAKFMTHGFRDLDPAAYAAAGLDPVDPTVRRLLRFTRELIGVPRHLSIHVGGFILSDTPLGEIVPIENGRMADRTVIQWNKDDVDAMGMFKLDLLGLGMLTMLRKCFALIADGGGPRFTLEDFLHDDEATYAMLRDADSVGVFQVESRAQMNMLPRLGPRTFYDLVIEVAIVRPGPIEGKMVHPFLRRRRGLEPIEYPHPDLEPILAKTLGVPLFQEQVMRLAIAVGGYTPGEADQLRRDMGSWRRDGRLERHRERLRAGMKRSGLTDAYAERVLQQIEGFGSYGFPESHAAAFAYLAYVSAYLKRHHPVAFTCALLNAQPMGFYSPASLIEDLKRHGGEVRPIDVQCSAWDATLEDGALRLGLRLVKGLGEATGRAIAAARARGGPFASLEELARRAAAPGKALVPLAAAGALRSLHHRRAAVWKAAQVAREDGELFRGVPRAALPAALPRMSVLEKLSLDIEYGRAFPDRHPMSLLRAELDRQGVLSAAELRRTERRGVVRIAGLVITRQRPEAAGGTVFVTLEDETGIADAALSAEVFAAHQAVLRLSSVLLVEGQLRLDGAARSVSAQRIYPLRLEIGEVPSRDFH